MLLWLYSPIAIHPNSEEAMPHPSRGGGTREVWARLKPVSLAQTPCLLQKLI